MSGKKDLLKSLFWVCIASGIIFILIVHITYRLQNPSISSEVRKYDGWYALLNQQKQKLNCNEKLVVSNKLFSVYNVLPQNLNHDSILFRTYHQCVKVIVNEQVIYEYGDNDKVCFTNTPGSSYHIVDLDNSFSGKKIELQYKSITDVGSKKIFDFYIGSTQDLTKLAIAENLPTLMMSLLLFVLGVFFIIFAIIFTKKNKIKQTLYIGMFTLLFSVWSILQSCVLQLIFENNLTFMFMQYVAFLIMPIAMTMYIRELFQFYEDKGLILLSACFCINFVCCILLQLLKIIDMRDIFLIIHILIVSEFFYIFYLLNQNYKDLCKSITCTTIRIMFIVMITILVDLYRYYNMTAKDEAKFTRISILIFMSYILIGYVQEIIKKSKEYTETKLMAKLAYKDVMTDLYNRTAYIEDIRDCEKLLKLAPQKLNLIFVIFDLNDLKVMNDFHGHGVGDHYIITTGKIIKKAFEKVGKCYRIGGDEFAVIINDRSFDDYLRAMKELNNMVVKENETSKLEYSIAYGYAVFEAGKYQSLKDLIDKADKNMYKNKSIYKENKIFLADFTT
ncbi:diguanylate cyclase (GGDEF)-like protein [Lachnotalea glycerini]|uniref:Diguanylate cyclase (GGDEF)-like protein n=1 Tax=Lachnotalea glycerini TaxID=1763509 RepID=A0A318EWJ7_9FIRM|nr:GGDEF domain-containing protein [Lachnotalea glycerini]PXV95446.1 diguanylate cyclase (GGDEF)-like protein [Lachnotalea glycerini]